MEGLCTLADHVVAARLGDAHGFGCGLAFRPGCSFGPQIDNLGIGGARGAGQKHQGGDGNSHGFNHTNAGRTPRPKTGYACYTRRSHMANPKYAASDKPVPVSELVDTLSDGTKVKLPHSPHARLQ